MSASRGKSDPTAKMQRLRLLQESLEVASKLTFCETPEDVAIFIGTTKSGKSTLLNSLLENKLSGEKEPKLRSVTIVKADNSIGPEIGRGPTSETIYPTRWIASGKLRGLVLWDSPGFEDNRGPIQDIINAYYVYHLFRNINSAKIVLVTDVNDILNDRINPFLTLLTSVENIFNEKLNRCFSNVVIAFTKVPTSLDDEPVDVEFISGVLEYQILSSDSMDVDISESSRNFIKHLIGNHRQIGLFKKAKVGPIPSNADAEIVQAINSIKGVHREILNTVSPSISHASKLFLYEVRHELTSNNSFVELEKSIKAAFEEKLSEYKRIAQHEESREILSIKKEELMQFKNIVQTIIDANTSFHSKIEALQKIDPKFKNKIDANNLMDKSKMMEFIDGVVGVKDSQIFNVNLRSLMESTKSDINEVIIDLQLKLHEIDKKEAEEMIKKVREEDKANKEKADEERKNYEKQNEEVEKRFFTQVGEKIGEAVDDFCDYCADLKNKFFSWL